jgi:hydrogenase maturation protease
LSKSLVIGYGNPDREDDGVAWHIVHKLAVRFGRVDPNTPIDTILDLDVGEPQHRDDAPDLLVELQLMPELAETLNLYDRVCFVDAHTGAYAHDVNVVDVQAEYQSSPFTHHITPQTCLEITRAAYGHAPKGLVVSVRGYQFGFAHTLSAPTARLAGEATEAILAWLKES